MPRAFTDEEAREQLLTLGYRALEAYPGSTFKWPARCVTCAEEILVVLSRVKRDDRPRCACVREARRQSAQAAGSRRVEARAAEAAAMMQVADWEPLEPYPGANQPWKSKCLRCGTVGSPKLTSQDQHRGCSGCSGRAARVTPEIAARVVQERGWLPAVSFPGPQEPWLCRCEVCGAESKIRYESVKARGSGCRFCAARENGRRRREAFEPQAVATMRAVGLVPQEPFPGSNKPWLCLCSTCGELVKPRYGNVASGSNGCQVCRRGRQGATKRARHAGAATARMKAVGYEPLEPYPGAESVWVVRCRCGRETTIRVGNVDAGQRGCRSCATYGLKASAPAVVYVLSHPLLNSVKVGITEAGSTRLAIFAKHGWDVVHAEQFEQGMDALQVEDAVLYWWRVEMGFPIHLTAEDTPTGGWTETLDADLMPAQATVEKVREVSKAILGMKGSAVQVAEV